MSRRRLGLVALAAGALFAMGGGEYSTWDWYQLRRARAGERARIEALKREVDSLKREAVAYETDPATQERAARELFGMVRSGEFLYSIIWNSGGANRERRP